jgi:hypothetical protein
MKTNIKNNVYAKLMPFEMYTMATIVKMLSFEGHQNPEQAFHQMVDDRQIAYSGKKSLMDNKLYQKIL